MSNSNVPKIRFPNFNEDWELKPLKDISLLTSGGTPNRKNKEYWNGTIPWITTSEIHFNVINKAREYISDLGLKNSSAKLFPKNTILIAMYGQGKTRGQCAILNIEAATNQACAGVIVHKDVDYLFIYHTLVKNYDKLRSLSNDGSQKNLSLGLLKTFHLAVPNDIAEQQKISSFFTLIDQKVKKQLEKIEQLELFKKGMMEKIFSQEIRFKDKYGKEFPEWETRRLSDFGSTYTGLSGKTKEDFGLGEANFVTYMNVFSNIRAKSDGVEQVDIGDGEKQNLVMKEDLLFTTSSETPEEVGMVSYWGNDEDNVYLNSFCFGYRLNDATVKALFLAYLLRSKEYRAKINLLAQGSTRYNLSKTELLKIEVKIPSVYEQQKIIDYLSILDEKIDKEVEKLVSLKELKNGFMQKMIF
ncbi:restriction endonuclease subunit S [Bacillus firmus]|uniref:restriction endonuclease subunit S n=1 Tax=Cytobacillus firmus TaxID=1399 RepID=UPI0015807266|nr:restriction endonuclease subunit S [Cytobacillus firmus]NUH86236.1 restriction endonuclease subunit S [Cytobacillus firmus]